MWRPCATARSLATVFCTAQCQCPIQQPWYRTVWGIHRASMFHVLLVFLLDSLVMMMDGPAIMIFTTLRRELNAQFASLRRQALHLMGMAVFRYRGHRLMTWATEELEAQRLTWEYEVDKRERELEERYQVDELIAARWGGTP